MSALPSASAPHRDEPGHADIACLEHWLGRFNAALHSADTRQLESLFESDSHWRDLLGLTWQIETLSGASRIGQRLAQSATTLKPRSVSIDPDRCPPRFGVRATEAVFEAFLRFQTDVGPCAGLVRFRRDRLSPEGSTAWSLLTSLESLHGHEEETLQARNEPSPFDRNSDGPNWQEARDIAAAYTDRDPTVLIVGGGHAGLTLAARLVRLGVDALVIDSRQRVGDNWRLRYHNLKLHNQKYSNHLPYLPFPKTWPKYVSKDQIANWLEIYVEAMEINFWTATTLEGADYDVTTKTWRARLRDAKGSERVLSPRHLVMATSVSGTPNLPNIPTLDAFKGTVSHSSRFAGGAAWRGRRALVMGTGTSAHDIAQDLHSHGAQVTMVQRSPTLVVNVEPSAQLYDGVYLGDGPSLEDRDFINASMTLDLVKVHHKALTDQVRELDKPMLEGLSKAGFRLDFGEGGTGWPLKYRQRGGGYYFNVGCSELIIDGKVGLIQYDAIERFTDHGIAMKDGGEHAADLVVLATGYKGLEHVVGAMFGDAVAQRVGPIWGFDPDTQELRNMWTRTGQPGLWFTAGAFSQCRIYSKYLALQIKAVELGLIEPSR